MRCLQEAKEAQEFSEMPMSSTARGFLFPRDMVYKVQMRDRDAQGRWKEVREAGEKYEDSDPIVPACLKVKEPKD